MKRLSVIVLLLSWSWCVNAQNEFTFADNGTFESTDWVQPFLDYNYVTLQPGYPPVPNPGILSITRGDIAYEGSHSARIEIKNLCGPPCGLQGAAIMTVRIPFSLTSNPQAFAASVWIYFPSNEQNNPPDLSFPYNDSSPHTQGKVFLANPGASHGCQTGGYPSGIPVDTWVQLNPTLSGGITFVIPTYGFDTSTHFVFYIDKLETKRATIIAPNPTFDNNNSITLHPSGGLTPLPGHPVPSVDYSYVWSTGATTPSVTGLQPGVQYTATISQEPQGGGYGCDESYSYYFIPSPPLVPAVTSPNSCVGESVQLTASPNAQYGSNFNVPLYWRYAWYDAPTGGNLLGYGNTLTVGPFSTPGVRKYYAQVNIEGAVMGPSSERTEAVYTVDPSPTPQIVLSSNIIFKSRPLVLTANNPQPDYTYTYNFFYSSGDTEISDEVTSSTSPVSYIFEDQGEDFPAKGLHDITVTVTGGNGCTSTFSFVVEVKDIIPLCETIVPKTSDQVKLDKFSGQYVFQRNQNCSVDISFECIQGKVDLPIINKVVAAAATTYSDDWNYDYLHASQSSSNLVENGNVGKWRPKATFAYNKGSVNVDKNFNSGRFQLSKFNWQRPEVASRVGWLRATEITRYNANGDAVEELNALNVPSTAKFGYDNALPYLMAQNADYNSVYFESFEKKYVDKFEEATPASGGVVATYKYHSGSSSFMITSSFESRDFTKSLQIENKGLLVRLWIATTSESSGVELSIPGYNVTRSFAKIAQSGEWSLMEARAEAGSFTVPTVPQDQTFKVRITKTGSGNVWIDDVRIQPADAEMTCYVYDTRTLKVLTVLDDQHFGLFYQYNAEGKLVRKLIETEKGIKTVQETQYNFKKGDKNDFFPQP